MSEQKRVMFICTHNSARSQMAEGMLRAWGPHEFEVYSAGTEATSVRPEAIAVMREIGIDISHHESKTVERFLGEPFDYVITVCDQAREACPVFPGAADTAHWGFDDPAAVEGTDVERLAAFRRVRDEIAQRLRPFMLVARRDDLTRPTVTALGGPPPRRSSG